MEQIELAGVEESSRDQVVLVVRGFRGERKLALRYLAISWVRHYTLIPMTDLSRLVIKLSSKGAHGAPVGGAGMFPDRHRARYSLRASLMSLPFRLLLLR